jgi:LAO/AO transport system kinase
MMSMVMDEQLLKDVLDGRRRAIARMLTRIENQHPDANAYLAQLFPHTGRAWVIGVTGAPGTGKSSLVNRMAKIYRERDKTVAIIAVDPTSPFSGGAILGDRIRMTDLSGDSGVFIRSMATRGSLGGLARTTRDATRIMDAAGFDVVLVETVGAGQSEVDIVRTADTTLVVEAPGLGDDVQAIKAGILEIADILVVNKADRQGANQTMRALRAMLELGHPSGRDQFAMHHGKRLTFEMPQSTPHEHEDGDLWIPPVMPTVSLDGTGVDSLLDKIDEHRTFVQSSTRQTNIQERYIELELYERLQLQLMQRLSKSLSPEKIKESIALIRERQLDPQSVVNQLLGDALLTNEHLE